MVGGENMALANVGNIIVTIIQTIVNGIVQFVQGFLKFFGLA